MELSKAQQILDKYPEKPKRLTYQQIANQFGVKRQYVWSLFNKTPERNEMLTKKQRDWANLTAKTGKPMEAALEVYDTNSKTSASTIASLNLNVPQVRAYLIKLMDEGGLNATDIVTSLKSIINEGVNSKTAEARDAVKALELVAKLKDLMPSTKVETLNKNLNIDINAPVSDLLSQLQQLTEENQKLITELTDKK